MSSAPKAKRELAPEGVHKAVCVHVIDLGTQEFTIKGKQQSSRKVSVGFELIGKKNSFGDPLVVQQRYTFSNSKKSNLMKDLKGWLGIKDPDFDLDGLAYKPAQITITHSEDGEYANITNVGGVPKGTKFPKPVNKFVSLYLDDTFDKDVFDDLPDYFKEKIASSPEYDEVAGSGGGSKKKSKKAKSE